jgi:hypothetical protein
MTRSSDQIPVLDSAKWGSLDNERRRNSRKQEEEESDGMREERGSLRSIYLGLCKGFDQPHVDNGHPKVNTLNP